jgi:hypothetical protein
MEKLMSLDVGLQVEIDGNLIEVYGANITHNLGKMAEEAGIYDCLWQPLEHNLTHARDIITPLKEGLEKLKADPEYFETFNSPNGWGLYKHFVPFVEKYLAACEQYPSTKIWIWK